MTPSVLDLLTPPRARPQRAGRQNGAWIAALVLAAGATGALAQSTQRAVFVANNGNLEGSVTSFLFNADGSPRWVHRVVTGSRPNSQSYHPGTNAYAISLSPNGRWLVTSHATSSTTTEQLTFFRVNADATFSIIATAQTPDSPLDVQWITDELLAVTLTNVSLPNKVITYRFLGDVPSIQELDREDTGFFSAYLTLHPSKTLLLVGDSTGFAIRSFRINPDGTLELLDTTSTGNVYPLNPCVTRDGARFYAGGGISAGGNRVLAYSVSVADGVLTPVLGMPFESPGASPKSAVSSSDDRFLFVAHGTDATCRTFAIDAESGQLTPTGAFFDVGLQGSLGDVAVLDDLLLITDNTTATDGLTGLYSFTIQPDGSFTPNGPIASTAGIAPTALAVWKPTLLVGDLNCDGLVNNFDIDPFVLAIADPEAYAAAYPGCNRSAADVNGDGLVNNFDIDDFVALLAG
ncbi:MAG: beta-propeller fold lactonase family protein [Phycisphaerae bacterium]